MTHAEVAATLLAAALCAGVGTGLVWRALTRRPVRVSSDTRTVLMLVAALVDLSAAAVAVLALKHPPP